MTGLRCPRLRGTSLLVPLAGALAAASLGACANQETVVRCESLTLYRAAESAGPLRVPDDLSVPDESEALRIPQPELGEADLERVYCLELSPGFEGVATVVPSDDD